MFCAILIPSFRLQAVLRDAPELRNQPVALIEGGQSKGIILEMTAAAAASGVALGMTATQGLARRADLQVTARSLAREKSAQQILLQTAYQFSPRIEETAPGICTMDMKGLAADAQARSDLPEAREKAERWGSRIAQSLLERELQCQVGIGPNPELSLRAAPCADPVLIARDARAFLDGLAIDQTGIPPALLDILRKWGIRRAGDFTALDRASIGARLGAEGLDWHDRLSGKKDRPLTLIQPAESFEEAGEFPVPIETVEPVLFRLRRFIDQLCSRAEARHQSLQQLRLELRLADGGAYRNDFILPTPTAEADALFRMAQTHLETVRTASPIVGLKLSAEPCQVQPRQLGFFDASIREPRSFSESMARLAAILPANSAGAPVLQDSHRTDDFRMEDPMKLALKSPFENFANGDWTKPIGNAGDAMRRERRARPALRRLRPAVRIEVELADGGRRHFAGVGGDSGRLSKPLPIAHARSFALRKGPNDGALGGPDRARGRLGGVDRRRRWPAGPRHSRPLPSARSGGGSQSVGKNFRAEKCVCRTAAASSPRRRTADPGAGAIGGKIPPSFVGRQRRALCPTGRPPGGGSVHLLAPAHAFGRRRERAFLQRGRPVDLAIIPKDDAATFELMRRADTLGVFQIESRAQIATLPRLQPRCFYDVVIEVAIIRPGPIQGHLMHPYLARRAGKEPVSYYHPDLESALKPVLGRTLGVPLFQEQMRKMAMVLAGFSGNEAEELRRALSFHRSQERMQAVEKKLRAAMARNGIDAQTVENIVQAIASFALYGFPESHAISFAILAYGSAYLKVHRPEEFYTALLNNQPMGFYSPATLLKDAVRRGVKFRPVCAQTSGWPCVIESDGAIRLGLCLVQGLSESRAKDCIAQRRAMPFHSLDDFKARSGFNQSEQRTLAEIGALNGFSKHRRNALWQIEKMTWPADLFESPHPESAPPDAAPEMPPLAIFRSVNSDMSSASLVPVRA